MKITIQISKGKMRMIDMSLDREAEDEMLKRIDDNQKKIAACNTLAEMFQFNRD